MLSRLTADPNGPTLIALKVATSQPAGWGAVPEIDFGAIEADATLAVLFWATLDWDGDGLPTNHDLRAMADCDPNDGMLWADLNCDGRVTTADYAVVKEHLGERVPEQ